MTTIFLQNSLINFSFVCIFSTTLFFWIKFSFFSIRKIQKIDQFLITFCTFEILIILVNRWILTNHFPVSNLYESLIFLSFVLFIFLIYLQIIFKKTVIGVIILPVILFIITFTTFVLPIELQTPKSLVPALQSNWLLMHVTIMMISYGALLIGSLLSITFLISNFFLNFFLKKINLNTIGFIGELDNLSYKIINFGFPLLTLGIISGSVWANETWGSYWSWDPKETWAFITWLVYAIYLHSRIIKGWRGTKPAIIATIGFIIVWICYLGVNIFGKGLHSYGWFSTTGF